MSLYPLSVGLLYITIRKCLGTLDYASAAFIACCSANSLPAANGRAITFPGAVKELFSPTNNMKVYYVDPGKNKDGLHLYSVRLLRKDGHIDSLDTFTRSVDVSWSPSGELLYVTDFVGSNVADCLAITPAEGVTRGRSLTGVLGRSRLQGVAAELHGDHVYVMCSGWVSPSTVAVELTGDRYPIGWDRHFTYNFRTGVLRSAGNARPSSTAPSTMSPTAR